MTTNKTIGLFLLATTFLSSPAGAAALTPTLDTIKSEAADLSGNFALSELTGDLPEGAVKVAIAGKDYYFTPSGDDAALLATLAGTSAGSLVESPNGIFELNGQKYGFDVASIPDSVFEYTAGTKDDYNFTVQEADAEGNLTDKYYKINLKPEYFSTSKSISWTEVGEDKKDETGVVAVNLPNNQTKYFQYTYTKPDGYETITKPELVLPTITDPRLYVTYQTGGAAVNNPSGKDYGDIESKVFKDNKVSGKFVVTGDNTKILYIQGGAIYNGGKMGNIRADFINNAVTGTAEGEHASIEAAGGAIFNAKNAVIGDITGDFIGNYATASGSAFGGAISNGGEYNSLATIGDITGDFIGNYAHGSGTVARATGGAIDNDGTIGNITGDFIGNYASSDANYAGGGAIHNETNATIGNIIGNFIGNYDTSRGSAYGGAIYNENATIGNITGDFIGNYAFDRASGNSFLASTASGAIDNYAGTIGNISGNFIGNYVSSEKRSVAGGAITNRWNGTIGDITGDFIGNSARPLSLTDKASVGGAIHNDYSSTIGNISGDFIGNYATQYGGAIYNGYGSVIGDISGDFIGNTLSDKTIGAVGGAIANNGTIGHVTGNFISNSIVTTGNQAQGGALASAGDIKSITGNFIDNHISANLLAAGGALYGIFTNSDINGNFVNNSASASSADGYAIGGGIFSAGFNTIHGSFLNNSAVNTNGSAFGGGFITIGSYLSVVNNQDNPYKFSGSVQSRGKDIFLSGNYTHDKDGKFYNAVSIVDQVLSDEEWKEIAGMGYDRNKMGILNFDTSGGGRIIINDNINSFGLDQNTGTYVKGNVKYNLSFTGDGVLNEDGLTDQYVAINNDVINAGAVTVEGTTLRFGAYQHEDKTANNWDGKGGFWATLNPDGTVNKDAAAVTTLSLNNAAFDIANTYMDTVNLKGWKASGDSYLHIDVDPDKMSADMLNINGNVEGQTKVVVYASSATDIRGKGSIAFAQSENDTTGNQDSFSIFRVYGSPYMYEVDYAQTEANKKQWGLTMGDAVNPDKDVKPNKPGLPDVPDIDIPDINIPDFKPMPNGKRKVAPEVVAMGALPAAAIEQSRNMVDNVASQLTNNRFYTASCSFVDANWNGDPYKQLWINPTYYTSNYDAPFDIDADVWGIEAGGDLQHDLNNKLGLFVSYRKGSYDMNGRGKHYYSTIGSEIDIDSYLAGLYYRYDRNNWYAFATLYGGIQQADIKTDDGVKSDTDGVEFGASLEAGYDYALTDTVYLTPSLGVFYTQVNYDDATDSVGKKAKYNDLRQVELEAGVKLTKAFRLDEGYANAYVKPSVVQTLVDGDEVNITGLGKVNTLDDETLGRIELGGRYGFTDQLSAYGWANYTFGSDYDATTVGLGLNYAF